MEENRINGLTEEEEQEYTKLTNLEAMGKGMGKELPEKQKQRLKDLRARIGETLLDTEGEGNSADKKKRTTEYVQEIPYELKRYRNEWKINIRKVSDESKEKIVKAAENIPVEIENYYNGSRLIKLKLGNKTYKILDAISTIYSDNDYGRNIAKKNITGKQITELELPGMIGDDVNERKNQKLKKYVKEKEAEGLHIPKQEEVKGLLQELGQKAGLNDIPDQIALLMYLTGMEGEYWLSMNHAESNNHGRGAFRDMVDFSVIDRGLGGGVNNAGGNLCMIGGEGE